MKIKLSPQAAGIIIPRVRLTGPKGFVETDLILDTGAVYTMISWVSPLKLFRHKFPH